MKEIRFTFCFCMAVFVFASGCISPRNPLPRSEGWKSLILGREIRTVPKEVMDDSQAYIQQLPAKERNQLTESSIHFFGDTSGQHAVSFDIGRPALFGEVIWTHVLIYDADHKCTKVIKRKTDRSLII